MLSKKLGGAWWSNTQNDTSQRLPEAEYYHKELSTDITAIPNTSPSGIVYKNLKSKIFVYKL